MHTVELLEQATSLAEDLGYGVRYEWLGGASAGACEIAGKKWIFIDLALSVVEQLEQVTKALRSDPGIYMLTLNAEMAALLDVRGAA